MISVSEALVLLRFSPAEKHLLAKIESVIDDSIAREYSTGKMAGAPIRLDLQEVVDPKIAYAVARNYETTGNWKVSVLGVAPLSLQFVPFVAVPAMQPRASVNTLPPLTHAETKLVAPASKRVLIRFPTRSRPRQALEVLSLYRTLAGIPVDIEVVIDEDDAQMMAAPVLQRLDALGCVVTVGKHKSKVEACNAGRLKDWDILVLASDDMVPVVNGYAARIVEEMERAWPHLDGAVYFSDGVQKENLSTLPIIGRRFYEQFGSHVYEPSYRSLFCDTEQTVLWKQMKRLAYVPEMIIEHRHHVWGKSQNDALYQRNDALFKADEAIFMERLKQRYANAQFTFLTPPIWLSVCIATLPNRAERLRRLVDELYRQRGALLHPGEVEIWIDAGEGTVGAKRQRLLEKSNGHFVSFVDDDDLVAHDYLARILTAIHENPTVDCLSLTGTMTTSGNVSEKFVHALGLEWGKAEDGTYLRGINHLNPVRREIALQAGFPDLNHAEDHDYSTKLAPLLKTQADLGDLPAYFYLFHPGKGETGGVTT